jgi:hypothetical protein
MNLVSERRSLEVRAADQRLTVAKPARASKHPLEVRRLDGLAPGVDCPWISRP